MSSAELSWELGSVELSAELRRVMRCVQLSCDADQRVDRPADDVDDPHGVEPEKHATEALLGREAS